jgi:DNA-binding MarR family transcriptional regulator
MTDVSCMTGKLPTEPSLGYYLSKARNVLMERMDRAVEPLGLTASQIGVIMMLDCGYANTPFELSRRLSYDSGSMTRMLDRLERKGFIMRTRSAADRRMIELVLTERGKDAAQQLPSVTTVVLQEQLRGFSPEEVSTLIGLLSRFIANGTAAARCADDAPRGEDSDDTGAVSKEDV